jgi:hypothetical protein
MAAAPLIPLRFYSPFPRRMMAPGRPGDPIVAAFVFLLLPCLSLPSLPAACSPPLPSAHHSKTRCLAAGAPPAFGKRTPLSCHLKHISPRVLSVVPRLTSPCNKSFANPETDLDTGGGGGSRARVAPGTAPWCRPNTAHSATFDLRTSTHTRLFNCAQQRERERRTIDRASVSRVALALAAISIGALLHHDAEGGAAG